MSDRKRMIRAFMAGLVDEAGGVDAAAALIGARTGAEVSKGSVSKRLSGALDWPLSEILALEDAVGNPCVRRWLAQTLPGAAEDLCLMSMLPTVSREGGEALASLVGLMAGSASLTDARKEVAEAITALQAVAAHLKDRADA